MIEPLISIVIVNYNGKDHLKICLNSLLKTNYPNYEITIVDNGSTDSTVEFVKENYPGVKIIALPKNYGFSCACSVGVLNSLGEYIAVLNNDIEVDRNWLLPLVTIMQRLKDVAAVDSKYMNFFDRKKFDIVSAAGRFVDPVANVYALKAGEVDDGGFSKVGPRFAAITLFRRQALFEVGLFDGEYFFGYDDIDLCWRIWLRGYRVLYVPYSVIYHKSSASVKGGKRLRSGFYYLTKRNQLVTLLKNYSWKSLAKYAPIIAFDYLTTLLYWTLARERQYTYELVKALAWVMGNLRKILRKRFVVQHHVRKVDDKVVERLFVPYGLKWIIYGRGQKDLIQR